MTNQTKRKVHNTLTVVSSLGWILMALWVLISWIKHEPLDGFIAFMSMFSMIYLSVHTAERS